MMFGGLFKKKMKSNEPVNPIQSNTDINAQLQKQWESIGQQSANNRRSVGRAGDDDFNKRMMEKNSVFLKDFK